MYWIEGDCVFLEYGIDYEFLSLMWMSLIVDDFLFLNIYICYMNCMIIIYFLSNSGRNAIRYPTIVFLEPASLILYFKFPVPYDLYGNTFSL